VERIRSLAADLGLKNIVALKADATRVISGIGEEGSFKKPVEEAFDDAEEAVASNRASLGEQLNGRLAPGQVRALPAVV
jgi:hypothetical protein